MQPLPRRRIILFIFIAGVVQIERDILGALCGMSHEDLIFEYEFTSLSIWGIRSRNYKKFLAFEEKFFALPGETLREKAVYYLKKYASLTDRQIERIYTIMVEKIIS